MDRQNKKRLVIGSTFYENLKSNVEGWRVSRIVSTTTKVRIFEAYDASYVDMLCLCKSNK